MIDKPTQHPPGSTARTASGHGLISAERIASETKTRWVGGESPDVAAVLAEHPELKKYRSVVLDLACTEYRHRIQAGESLDADDFSQRFPSLQKSLYFLIEVDKLLPSSLGDELGSETVTWPEPGEEFFEFSLIAELGRGTFGRVFLAIQPSLSGRRVVLKVAPRGRNEAEILAKLQHPNIVPVYSVQEEELTGLSAVCMPYLGRTTLCDVLDRAFADSHPPTFARVILDTITNLSEDHDAPSPVAFDRILDTGLYVEGIAFLSAQLADALAYAHSRGICHRDLKPSNVLVSSDGHPLLLDFNLSSDKELATYRLGGTLPYMAPEQLRTVILERPDGAYHADPRSDLFSLGVICYELLCGSLPFVPVSWDRPMEEVARQLLDQQKAGPPPIQVKNPQVDRQLAQLVNECLAFDAEQRPQTAVLLAASFRKQLTPLRRTSRWLRRHRRPVRASVFLMMVGVLSIAAWLVLRAPYSIRRFQLGLEYSRQGRYERSLQPFTDSIQANPKDSEVWFARGRAYQALGDFQQAFANFKAALQLSPTPQANACAGYSLSKLNYHSQAIAYYRAALAMGYDRAPLHNDMGVSLLKLRDMHNAETCFRKAIAANPSLSAAHRNLISVLLDQAYLSRLVSSSAMTSKQRLRPFRRRRTFITMRRHCARWLQDKTPTWPGRLLPISKRALPAAWTRSRYDEIRSSRRSARGSSFSGRYPSSTTTSCNPPRSIRSSIRFEGPAR
jgi:serine/threonine protein kinase